VIDETVAVDRATGFELTKLLERLNAHIKCLQEQHVYDLEKLYQLQAHDYRDENLSLYLSKDTDLHSIERAVDDTFYKDIAVRYIEPCCHIAHHTNLADI
jgi:hypothetical protein